MNRIDASNTSEISLEDLRKYLCYAKMKVFPKLSEEAAHML
jgi:DNA replicative helicase MCM subunit Mcm2 (Cdc46/Mcm family)